MFIAALFTIARTWKQPKCPSVLCDHLEGWDREGGREGDAEGRDMVTYVYV